MGRIRETRGMVQCLGTSRVGSYYHSWPEGWEGEVTWTQGLRYMQGATYRSWSLWVKDTANPWQPCRKGLGE